MSAPDSSLDDIFGSSPPEQTLPKPHSTVEPSELPSLRRQHVTAGYRDGISASRAEHVQQGFDAGFPVGAQLGMRAGTIIGIIEGILRGYEESTVVKKPGQKSPSPAAATAGKEADEAKRAAREQMLALYRKATKDLDVQAVFAGLDSEGKDEKPEAQLLRKGDEVLAAWEQKVPVAAWEEHIMDVLEAKSDNGHDPSIESGGNEGSLEATAAQS
ncbi:hypothetical protein BJY04DRAFT_170563 [Aspergillus karnatakaensis]|uniref:Yae1 family protein n=1 Tax=Aspergillus karnatakaensis TaxID=1810916 RepID=UPI003CCCC735